MINKNWPKWIFASITKHFDDNKDGLTLFVEGQHRNDPKTKEVLELRFDGPTITEVDKNIYNLIIEINVLVQVVKSDVDLHKIHRNVGIAAAAFTDVIHIYKYGSESGDDQSEVGCLILISNARNRSKIKINHYGEIAPAIGILQATAEGQYKTELTGVEST